MLHCRNAGPTEFVGENYVGCYLAVSDPSTMQVDATGHEGDRLKGLKVEMSVPCRVDSSGATSEASEEEA